MKKTITILMGLILTLFISLPIKGNNKKLTDDLKKSENNGKSVVVRINNRGPYSKGRIIDLSQAAFSKIENMSKGVTKVKLEIVK